jgi:hypothetical protein
MRDARNGRDLRSAPDGELEDALRDLGGALAWPPEATTGPTDPAARARMAIQRERTSTSSRTSRSPRPRLRWSLGLAVAGILVIAAAAAAIGFGLPGIRILFTSSPVPLSSPSAAATPITGSSGSGTTPSADSSPSPTSGRTPIPGPPGSTLGLGDPLPVDGIRTAVAFAVRLPPATVGAPASAWLLDGRLSLVWPTSAALPPLQEPSVGLVLTQMEGDVDPGYFEKILGPRTTIETVRVDGVTGYWITGSPHEIVYVNPDGEPMFDSRRVVGDSLLWARDGVTYRLETRLDRDAAIALANALR